MRIGIRATLALSPSSEKKTQTPSPKKKRRRKTDAHHVIYPCPAEPSPALLSPNPAPFLGDRISVPHTNHQPVLYPRSRTRTPTAGCRCRASRPLTGNGLCMNASGFTSDHGGRPVPMFMLGGHASLEVGDEGAVWPRFVRASQSPRTVLGSWTTESNQVDSEFALSLVLSGSCLALAHDCCCNFRELRLREDTLRSLPELYLLLLLLPQDLVAGTNTCAKETLRYCACVECTKKFER